MLTRPVTVRARTHAAAGLFETLSRGLFTLVALATPLAAFTQIGWEGAHCMETGPIKSALLSLGAASLIVAMNHETTREDGYRKPFVRNLAHSVPWLTLTLLSLEASGQFLWRPQFLVRAAIPMTAWLLVLGSGATHRAARGLTVLGGGLAAVLAVAAAAGDMARYGHFGDLPLWRSLTVGVEGVCCVALGVVTARPGVALGLSAFAFGAMTYVLAVGTGCDFVESPRLLAAACILFGVVRVLAKCREVST